ncbi:MAG: hypothetical protein Q7U20_09995 [Caulobacter sp.]|nr:hypothetical protein [Caulobacter sp.]
MKKASVALAVAFLLSSGSSALTQETGFAEIVVTASRITEYDPLKTPHVVLIRRADNLITQLTVVCDTRDESLRKAELKATLLALIRAAGPGSGIELGLGEEIVGRFDASMLDAVIVPDRKPDTSRAVLIIKTRVTAGDTFDSATGRIESFVGKAATTGRTEILRDDEWNLTLIGPERYRADIISLIAADSKRSAGAFGEGYGVTIEGLNLPVSWYQSGPLDLALYLPYRQTIRPAGD